MASGVTPPPLRQVSGVVAAEAAAAVVGVILRRVLVLIHVLQHVLGVLRVGIGPVVIVRSR